MIKPFDIRSFTTSESLDQSCSIIWEHYLSRKREDDFEPSWVLEPYALVKKFLDKLEMTEEEKVMLLGVLKSHLQEDGKEVPVRTGFPNEGSRIMHDCWKAGSFTWIFMGRRYPHEIFKHGSFVITGRRLPDEMYDLLDKSLAPQVLYAAYDTNDISKNVGPAISIEALLKEI